jgi:hypothetical protein
MFLCIIKLERIPPENLEAIASATGNNPIVIPSKTNLKGKLRDIEGFPGLNKSNVDLQDLQMIFNNLSNLVIENSALKDKVEVRIELRLKPPLIPTRVLFYSFFSISRNSQKPFETWRSS